MIFRLVDNKIYTIEVPMGVTEKDFLKLQGDDYAYIKTPPKSKHGFYRIADSDNNYPAKDKNGNVVFYIEIDEERNFIKQKELWYKRLQKIFARKWLGIQAVIIGRDWGNTVEYIKAQIESYQNLALQAKKILENDPDDANAKAIVARYNESLELQYQVNLVLQQVRGEIEIKIGEATTYKDSYIDELLSYVDGIKLSKEELNDEKFQEIFQEIQNIINKQP